MNLNTKTVQFSQCNHSMCYNLFSVAQFKLTFCCFATICFTLLTFLTPKVAFADFHNVLDAYFNNEPELIISEVRKSVNDSDDRGLILFLNVLLNAGRFSDSVYVDSESTSKTLHNTRISSLLSPTQHKELKQLLWKIAKKCSTDAQYLLLHIPEFSSVDWSFLIQARVRNKYESSEASKKHLMITYKRYLQFHFKELENIADQGNPFAAYDLYDHYSIRQESHLLEAKDFDKAKDLEKAKDWLIKAAEFGHPIATVELGFKYLNIVSPIFTSNHGCENKLSPPKHNVCLTKNLAKGEFYLRKAVSKYLTAPNGHIRYFDTEIGKYFHHEKPKNLENLRQAFLWYNIALKSPEYFKTREAFLQVKKLYLSGWLKKISPELDGIWTEKGKRDLFLRTSKNHDLPDLVLKESEVGNLNPPVFLIEYNDFLPTVLEIYSDGRVLIGFRRVGFNSDNIFKDELDKVSPQYVAAFLQELKSAGFNQWFLSENFLGSRSQYCNSMRYGECQEDYYIASLQQENFPEKILLKPDDKPMKKLINLIEKYFPTRKFRCDVHGSQQHESLCNKFYKSLSN